MHFVGCVRKSRGIVLRADGGVACRLAGTSLVKMGPASPAGIACFRRAVAGYRGSVLVSSTTCWNVGRFWNGKGGTETPLALIQRFMSKQLACGFSAQAPWP